MVHKGGPMPISHSPPALQFDSVISEMRDWAMCPLTRHQLPLPPDLQFDSVISEKREWVGKGEDGFPVLEGKVDEVDGKNLEIWCVHRERIWRGGAERGSGLGGR